MKVLFTTPVLEHPPVGGPQLRIENAIKALAGLCELHLIPRAPAFSIASREAEAFYRRCCRAFTYAPSVENLSENRTVRALQRIFRKARSEDGDAAFLLDYARARGIGIIWFGYGNISFPLIREVKEARPGLKVVCDTDSVWSRYIRRGMPFISDPERRREVEREGLQKEQEEREWVELCDITTAVSDVDARYYRSLAARPERIRLFSNAIDWETYVNIPHPPENLKRPCVYLAGSFWQGNSPMEMAARWVLDEILPRLRRRIPSVHLYIVGRGSDLIFGNLHDPGVTVTGRIPSVLPYLYHADVALVPLKFESGTRFKIMEAGACGIPVVSTTLGAEGLPVTDGRHLLLADEPDAFADAVARLIEDRSFARSLADNCRTLIRERCGIDTMENEAKEILQCLMQ